MSLNSLDRLFEAMEKAITVQLPSGILRHQYLNASDDIAAYCADHCKRQAVTVEYAFEHLVDENVYVFSTDHEAIGLDPWIVIDGGIDRNLKTGKYILCYGRTAEMHVAGDYRVFASRKAVEKASGAKLPESGFTGRR